MPEAHRESAVALCRYHIAVKIYWLTELNIWVHLFLENVLEEKKLKEKINDSLEQFNLVYKGRENRVWRGGGVEGVKDISLPEWCTQ